MNIKTVATMVTGLLVMFGMYMPTKSENVIPIVIGVCTMAGSGYTCYTMYQNYKENQSISELSEQDFIDALALVCEQQYSKFAQEISSIADPSKARERDFYLTNAIKKDFGSFVTCVNTLTGSLNKLGRWQKIYKNRVTPTLDQSSAVSRLHNVMWILENLKQIVENLDAYKEEAFNSSVEC